MDLLSSPNASLRSWNVCQLNRLERAQSTEGSFGFDDSTKDWDTRVSFLILDFWFSGSARAIALIFSSPRCVPRQSSARLER
jgi:hypothetical protein